MNGDPEARWTIEELGRRVADALESAGYDGVASGRVRDVPDPRTIRYYATIGLMDRPCGARGRVALYGSRHLLQLAAIKRLQAEGRTLGEIQRRLAGASDVDLDHINQECMAGALSSSPGPRRRPAGRGGAAFWKERPTPAPAPAPSPSEKKPDPPFSLQGLRLGPRATLLLQTTRPPDSEDLRVIELAAAPLLEILRMRGLIEASSLENDREGTKSPLPTEEAP